MGGTINRDRSEARKWLKRSIPSEEGGRRGEMVNCVKRVNARVTLEECRWQVIEFANSQNLKGYFMEGRRSR